MNLTDTAPRYYWGGPGGYRPGDEVDAPDPEQPLRVTTDRTLARYNAHLIGYGTLYRVDVDVAPDDDDTGEEKTTRRVQTLTVVAALDRAVDMPEKDRRRLHRKWGLDAFAVMSKALSDTTRGDQP